MGAVRRPASVVASFVLCLALAPAAHAAIPFTAGVGYGHDLAVGDDGTGHVVWYSDGGAADRVHYCRVPAGGAGCDPAPKTLDFPGPALSANTFGSATQVFVTAPNTVIILGSCISCGPGSGDPAGRSTFRWFSTDNGVTFTGPTLVGDQAINGQAGYLGVGDPLLGVEGREFQAMPPNGADPIDLGGDPTSVYSPAVVPVAGTDKVVHAVANLDGVKYAVFDDPGAPPITVPELNTLANWSVGNALAAAEGDNDQTHLSGGPSGTFLSYRFLLPNDSSVGVRRFDPATNAFGLPVYAQGSDPIEDFDLRDPDHSQDGAGRLHVVWSTIYDGGRLRYTRSDDGGSSFGPAATLAVKEAFVDPAVATAPSGAGFAVWSGMGDTPIRVVALEPITESAAGPPEISDLSIDDSTLAPGQSAVFTFTSSEAGNAVLTLEKRLRGLKLGKAKKKQRCKPRTKKRYRSLRRQLAKKYSGKALKRKLKKRRCWAWTEIGRIEQAVSAGPNAIVFSGKIADRNLRPGRYRASLVVSDLEGNVSRTETIEFKVTGKKASAGQG